MGVTLRKSWKGSVLVSQSFLTMVKAMKAMKAMRAMTQSDVFGALEKSSGVKKKDCKAVLGSLQGLVVSALKSHGKFVIPGVSMIKLRHKKARPAGKRMAFGKEIKVKAKPACKVVKCFAPKSLKENF